MPWPTARLDPAVSSPKTTVNITLIFSSLTNTELEPHPPVLFQHVCSFHFKQSLICMLYESFVYSTTPSTSFLFCREPRPQESLHRTGDTRGAHDPSLGSPLGRIPGDPRARRGGEERSTVMRAETCNNFKYIKQLCRPHGDQS